MNVMMLVILLDRLLDRLMFRWDCARLRVFFNHASDDVLMDALT